MALLTCVALSVVRMAVAAQPDTAAELLRKADDIRSSNYPGFTSLLESVKKIDSLSSEDREYLRYLEAYKSAYDGDNATALARLTALLDDSKNPTMRVRAGSTAVNLLALDKRYEDSFLRLSTVLELLPDVSDPQARQQAQLNAADLYKSVGQYDLSLSYAQQVIDANLLGRGICKGSVVKMLAMYESGHLKTVGNELRAAINECTKVGEPSMVAALRMQEALTYINQRRLDEAIKVLRDLYDQVQQSRNPRLIARWNSVLADAYRKKGLPALAQLYANYVIDALGKDGYPPNATATATAYEVLYEVAKQRGEYKSALEYYERFAAQDKANLDDLSARHLAFQKVHHENIASKLQVDALNKQNHVLQLEKELGSKAVETSRLYIVLLAMTVLFIGLWAYRTKRSQLHFQNLARLDGLTGICNRPHFITQAEKALEASRRGGEQLCIVLCDLDHFKQINDKYGHATGDFVLKRTVSACNIHLGKNDIFGRFGGEEFAFLLPGCGTEDARHRAEQLRVAIAGITAYQTGSAKATVSASFGIASTSASGHELGQLLAHADSALYEAKRMGRNRVVVFSHMPATGDIPALAIVSTTGEFVQVTGRSSSGN